MSTEIDTTNPQEFGEFAIEAWKAKVTTGLRRGDP